MSDNRDELARAGERIRANAEATRRARELWEHELERRDDSILEEVDAGTISQRAAARAAGLSIGALHSVIARRAGRANAADRSPETGAPDAAAS